MMGKLLCKEFRLAMHPTVPMMLALSAMVFIPNYPYSVLFFYTTLSLFFTCLQGREMGDVVYSLSLPVTVRQIVSARVLFAVLVETAAVLLTGVFVWLRETLLPGANAAGLDANLALLGEGFLMFGLFNRVFFGRYYRDVSRVGVPFLFASLALFLLVGAEVTATYAVPFVRDVLDTPDPAHLPEKLAFVAVCLLIYAGLTLWTVACGTRRLARQDIAA